MSDLPSRGYSGSTDVLYRDVRQALGRLRSDLTPSEDDGGGGGGGEPTDVTAADVEYTAGNASHWDTSPPTTVASAIDRLAAYISTNFGNP